MMPISWPPVHENEPIPTPTGSLTTTQTVILPVSTGSVDPITRQPFGKPVVWVVYDHIDGTEHAALKDEWDAWPTHWGWPGESSIFPCQLGGRRRYAVFPAGTYPRVFVDPDSIPSKKSKEGK